MPKGSEDGFFGEKTDKAVRLFQEHAIERGRMKAKEGKVFTVEKTLDQSGPDGIVGEKTRAELDRWYKENWVKPAPELYHGDYDDEGVAQGKGKRGGEDYHIETPVKQLQRGLKEKGFENVGADDGWFRDKTRDALVDFQSCAAETTRVVNGEPVEVEVTFTGSATGIFDRATQEEYELWEENDYHAPELSDSAMVFAAPGNGGWFVCEEKDIDSLISEVNELDNLRVEIEQFRESCATAKISEDTSQKAKEL